MAVFDGTNFNETLTEPLNDIASSLHDLVQQSEMEDKGIDKHVKFIESIVQHIDYLLSNNKRHAKNKFKRHIKIRPFLKLMKKLGFNENI